MAKVIEIGEEEVEPEVVEEVKIHAPIPDEEPVTTKLDDYEIRQKFVKRVYYSIILLIYLIFCYFMALSFMGYMSEEDSLLILVGYILIMAIIFPVAMISLGFTTGGLLIGPMVGATYGLMSLISRFIIKILGLDVELIFPELVGHVGVVRNPNALNKYTTYPLSVEIETAGLYGNSFWHGNKIAARSSEGEIPVGTNVKVIEVEYWSFSSLLRNSPVLKVVPFEDETKTSEAEVTKLDAEIGDDELQEEIALSNGDTEEVKEDYSEQGFMSIKKWGYLSYLLLALTWFSTYIIDSDVRAGREIGANFAFLPLMTVLSFSRYIYLRYNDEAFDLAFSKSVLSVKGIIQFFLILLLLPLMFVGIFGFLDFVTYGGDWEDFVAFLYPVIVLAVIFSSSFEEKNLKANEGDSEDEIVDDTPNKGKATTRFVQLTLGFSAFVVFVIGLLLFQWESGNFGPRYGTFANAIPCYSITFVLLVLMLATSLGAQGSSEPSQKEKIKATNWKKFKTRIVILVVVFSLLMPLLWYESERYWENRKSQILDYGEDCNDEIVGPDVDLVGADFSYMKLRGCDLSNRDLTGAVFSETILACVDFSNSILEGSYFHSPDIRGAIFDNADLSNSEFQGQTKSKDSYYGSYYYEIIAVDCDYDLSFKGANLTKADFDVTLGGSTRCDPKLAFDNAIMYNTNLEVEYWGYSAVSFDNAILDNANLVTEYWGCPDVTVSMVNVSFTGTKISTTLPPEANLLQSNMSDVNFIDFMALDLASCPLSLPETYNCAEIGDKKMIFGPSMDFSDKWITFWDNEARGADLSEANFSGLYIPNSIFQAVRINDSNMSDSNLSNSNFTYNHKIYNEQYLEYDACINEGDNCSTYAEAALEDWGIDDFSDLKYIWSTNLTNVDFTGSNLSYSDFSYANMVGAKLKDADLTGVIWYYTICPDGTNTKESGSCSAS